MIVTVYTIVHSAFSKVSLKFRSLNFIYFTTNETQVLTTYQGSLDGTDGGVAVDLLWRETSVSREDPSVCADDSTFLSYDYFWKVMYMLYCLIPIILFCITIRS